LLSDVGCEVLLTCPSLG